MYKIVDDLVILTNVGKIVYTDITETILSIISYDIIESIKNKEDTVKIDIGIGILILSNKENKIKYKFIPSPKLENTVLNSYKSFNNLEFKIDKSLSQRIKNAYEELI